MSSFRYYWRAAVLAVFPLLAFAVSYFALFEGKRSDPMNGYNYLWLFGSPLPVGAISGIMLYGMVDSAPWKPTKRRLVAWVGAFLIAGIYAYLLLFVVLNTMGS